MRRHLAAATTLAFALACSGLDGTEPVAEPPPADPPPAGDTPPPPAEEPDDPPVTPTEVQFTPRPLGEVPAGRTATLPGVIDVEIAAEGAFALALTADGLYRWDFEHPPARLHSPEAEVLDFAPSPFTDELFALVHRGASWTLERWTPAADGYRAGPVLYRSTVPLSDLVTAYAQWSGRERVFFASHGADGPQVLSTTRDGALTYEVTSPSGELSELTDPELRARADSEWEQPPAVHRAQHAIPLGVSPGSGALLWRDARGGLHERPYHELNWAADGPYAGAGATALLPSPNGWLTLEWSAERGAAVRGPDEGKATPIPGVTGATAPPAWAPNGRAVMYATADGLGTAAVPHPLAAVRFLWRGGDAEAAQRLARDGMILRENRYPQLYSLYEEMAYMEDGRPVFASIDGMLEVLHAGFEAVFVRTERDVSKPRLTAAATALQDAAKDAELARVAEIAAVVIAINNGDYSHPEAAAAKAGAGPRSALHDAEVDWADMKPRGPYAHDPELQDYFRAFKYMNALRLKDAERAALSSDAALRDALTAWNASQAAFSTGSRYRDLLGESWDRPAWVRADCVKDPQDRPRMAWPLFWGVDSELLDRTVAHDRLPPHCGVATRVLPTGLDLLAGLGSPYAVVWSSEDYAQWPALRDVHAKSREELAAIDALRGVVPGWWRIVQTLATDNAVPEGVSAEAWRARLAETALASWTSLRHTMVLVNEVGGAEMGGGGEEGFEWLNLEPARGSVDPVPAAWDALAETLDLLAAEARARGAEDRLEGVLEEVAADARLFGGYARQQARGEPLTEEGYDRIASYARAIEHPFLLFKAAAAHAEGGMVQPEPMQRIVDIYQWNNPMGLTQYWHAAVGDPQEIVVLAPDRGGLVPARGAIYSYREVVDAERVDDAMWRERVRDSEPLPWSATRLVGEAR